MTDESIGSDGTQRVAIVTGAAGGLGSSVAELLAKDGHYRLTLLDVREDELTRVGDRVSELGAEVQTLVVDLGEANQVEAVVPTAIARFGRVDALVNAAAVLRRQPLDDITAKSFDEVFHINTLAPLLLARAAFRDMALRDWGRIVNVTSTGVYEGGFTMTSTLYEASKGAVAVLTKMFSKSGAEHGILVNTVCPGGMSTRMLLEQTPPDLLDKAVNEIIPLRRLADPSEVAQIIVWLLGPLNTYATGAEFDITGGIAMH